MKKNVIAWLLYFAFILNGTLLLAQNCVIVNPPPPTLLTTYESKNGWVLPASGTVRILVVLAEINYDVGVDPNGIVSWPQGTFPSWGNTFVDVNAPSTGLFTKYFDFASSSNYQVLGDYLQPPSNGGVITVNNSAIQANGYQAALVGAINSQMTSGFATRAGLTNKSLFDLWTPTSIGLAKINSGNNAFDHVLIAWRNFSIPNGTGNSHGSSLGTILGFSTDTWSQFGAQDGMPLDIARHEYAHLFLGGNNFHVSGGREVNMWLGQNSAHSLLSLWGAALDCWSGWDRQRLDWKSSGNSFSISARNAGNTAEASGDLDATVAGQSGVYTLRDFVTTGDAIRIKLPFTPNNKYQEYIWVENHNGKTLSGNPFDEYRYAGGCISPATFGVYAYLQIGKDVNFESNGASNLFGSNSDYVRYISADGFHDETLDNFTLTNACWPPPVQPFVKTGPNTLTGFCDLDDISLDINAPNNSLDFTDRYPHDYEDVSGTYFYNVFQAGHSRQVFTQGGIKKFGIGYNPSCASMINMSGENYPVQDPKDERIIYLNGVSVEILSQSAGVIQVKIRFDDVDVVSDQRWCAPEINLNHLNTLTGYSLNITSGHKITLDQGLAATKMDNPITFQGQTLFTDPTVMRCKASSFINLESNSELIVDNNSQLILEANSRIDIHSGAILRVKRGGRLILNGNSLINNIDGKIIIENDGFVDYYQNCTVNLDGSNAVFEIDGLLNLQNNAIFKLDHTVVSHGYIKFNNTNLFPSTNITAGSNCQINIQGVSQNRKVLEVDQETMYGPASLTNFIIHTGKVEFNHSSRLQASGLSTSIDFFNARFTSNTPGLNNQHRGVHLYGQPAVNINSCIFEYGKYGIFAWLTYGGAPLTVVGSTFRHNTIGINAYDKGLNLFGCNFFRNQYGVYGGHMSFPSLFYQGLTGGSPNSSNQYGIRWQGPSTPVLTLNDPFVEYNNIGTRVDNCPLHVICGSVSWNNDGIVINFGASIHMDDQVAAPYAANVTAHGNGYTIHTVFGSYLYLYKGQNDLEPAQTGIGHAAFGILTNPPYTISVDNNWWGPQGLLSSEYNLTDGFANNYSLTGITLPNTTTCGQATPPCGNPPCDINDPLNYCPACDLINSDDFTNEPLNEAIKTALEKFNSSDPDKYIETIHLFYQILIHNYGNPDAKEQYLIRYSYNKMMEALGEAYRVGELSCNGSIPDVVNQIVGDVYFLVEIFRSGFLLS